MSALCPTGEHDTILGCDAALDRIATAGLKARAERGMSAPEVKAWERHLVTHGIPFE